MATKANTRAEREARRSRAAEAEQTAKSSTDALELLEQDHREVEELFDEFDETQGNDKRKEELAQKICRALEVHARIEEEVFYPRAREATKDDDLIDEAIVEHAGVKHLIAEIEAMEVGDDLYDAKVRVLEEMVKRHIQEEEEELFPELVSAKMDTKAVGRELAERKHELIAEMKA
ncbi:MAG TPA: hemerythrin domain-containing protein [Stellaceae bacterium]|jgi:hemerythrin superfamily protein|nr:hemerythrin domain-containing protein [Stellaceae bacterium]